MITDHDLAVLAAATYDPHRAWDFWDGGVAHDSVAYGVTVVDGVPVVAFRGSTALIDWRRDLDAWAEPKVNHPDLGPLHDGFFEGMEGAWEMVQQHIKPGSPWIVCGHSLGAARANIVAGLAAADGVSPARKVLFGEPKSGFEELAAVTSRIPGASYRNGNEVAHDIVTDVPYYVPPLLAYVHDRPLTMVCCPPPPGSDLGIFAWHDSNLYVGALKGTSK